MILINLNRIDIRAVYFKLLAMVAGNTTPYKYFKIVVPIGWGGV